MRKRCLPRTSASGASAGPSTETSGEEGAARRSAAPRMVFGVGPVVGGNDQRRKPSVGRQRATLAFLDFAGVERLRVAADYGPHHRVVRLIGLEKAKALAPGSPGAARHLIEQLEGALGGARIAIGEPQIGVHHPNQRHVGKIVPLGDKLGADHDIRLAFCDSIEFQPEPLHAPPISDERTMIRALSKVAATSSAMRSTPGPQATR